MWTAPLGAGVASRALLLLAVSALALAGPAAAQLDGGVDLRAQSARLEVSVDQPSTTELSVAHTGSPSGTGLDPARRVALAVTGLPSGWTASVDPPTFDLTPGQAAKATLRVAVSTGAPAESGTLRITARMYPGTALPGVGSPADPEATDSVEVQVVRVDGPNRVFIETVGPYAWVLLLAVVACVVVVVSLTAANRRVAVRIAADDTEAAAQPGGRAAFTVAVQNITRRDDTVLLRIAPLPEGWAGFLPEPQLDLQGGERAEAKVVVIPPKGTGPGTRQAVTVSATSLQAPRRPASVGLTVLVEEPAKRAKQG
jgi:hypothetical protein